MANLPRSAKSGKDWTPNDLDSYNISLNHQLDPLRFFDLQKFPQPSVGQELLNVEDGVTMQEDRHAQLISLLDLTMFPDEGENIVIDFTVKLFDVLGYAYRDRVACTRVNLEFLVCGEGRYAETDVCIFDQTRRETLLLVQTHKRRRFVSLDQTKDQLVAGAIAAFFQNNKKRARPGVPRIKHTTVPGIVMNGTSLIFFKIPITQDLLDHIYDGTCPPEETRVEFCYPPVPHFPRRREEGMKPLENRREILECFEAFKAIVGI